MAQKYTPVGWVDHSVERPDTYRETVNPDGTITLIPEEGEIIKQGTMQNATNFRHMDEAIADHINAIGNEHEMIPEDITLVEGGTGGIVTMERTTGGIVMPFEVRNIVWQNGTPTPTAPKPIMDAITELDIGTVGENWFDINAAYAVSSHLTMTINGNTCRLQAPIDVTASNGSAKFRILRGSGVLGKTYTIKGSIASSKDGLARISAYYLDAAGNPSVHIGSTAISGAPLTITLPNAYPTGMAGVAILLYNGQPGGEKPLQGDYVVYSDVQFNIGSSAKPCAPYTGSSQTRTLPKKLWDGKYDSTGKMTRDGDGFTANGTEDWAVYRQGEWTGTYVRFQLPNTCLGVKALSKRLCSQLVVGSATSEGYYPNTFLLHTSGTLYVAVEIAGVTDLASWKAYLAANPMTFYWDLATPETIQDEPMEIRSIPGKMNAYSNASEIAIERVSMADTVKEIVELRSELNELLTAAGGA